MSCTSSLASPYRVFAPCFIQPWVTTVRHHIRPAKRQGLRAQWICSIRSSFLSTNGLMVKCTKSTKQFIHTSTSHLGREVTKFPCYAWRLNTAGRGQQTSEHFNCQLLGHFERVDDFASSTEEALLQTEYDTSGQPQVPLSPTHICSLLPVLFNTSKYDKNYYSLPKPKSCALPTSTYQNPIALPGHRKIAAASSVNQLNMLIC